MSECFGCGFKSKEQVYHHEDRDCIAAWRDQAKQLAKDLATAHTRIEEHEAGMKRRDAELRKVSAELKEIVKDRNYLLSQVETLRAAVQNL